MRRRTTALSAVLALLVTGLWAAPSGVAAPYPPATHAQIFSSTTTPVQGQTIQVSGKDYLPNEDVRLTIGGIFVGTAHTDGAGSFARPAKVPATLLGDQPLTGVGASGLPTDRDSLTLTIRARGASNSAAVAGESNVAVAGRSNGAGGLSSTGARIALLVGVAVVLLAAGGVATRLGRRRRASRGV